LWFNSLLGDDSETILIRGPWRNISYSIFFKRNKIKGEENMTLEHEACAETRESSFPRQPSATILRTTSTICCITSSPIRNVTHVVLHGMCMPNTFFYPAI
jgi:hypothetical protein